MSTEAVDNSKLRILAFEDRWHYVAILCCKGQGILDSTKPELLDRIVGVKLGLDSFGPESALLKAKRRLVEVNLIDENWQPVGWEERQFQSDHSAAERMRKYRQRLKENPSNVTVTSPQRHSHVLDQNRTEQNRTEQSGTARKRASALPTGFGLTPSRTEYATKTLPNVDTVELLAAFCDHHSAKGTVAKDWEATWRTWVRNGLKFGYPMIAPAAQRSTPQIRFDANGRQISG